MSIWIESPNCRYPSAGVEEGGGWGGCLTLWQAWQIISSTPRRTWSSLIPFIASNFLSSEASGCPRFRWSRATNLRMSGLTLENCGQEIPFSSIIWLLGLSEGGAEESWCCSESGCMLDEVVSACCCGDSPYPKKNTAIFTGFLNLDRGCRICPRSS